MQPAAVSLLIVTAASALAPPRLFFDVATNAAALGRIEVELAAFDSLPRLVENLRLIAANERAPRCSFDGSRFRHAPQGPQYKWSHEFEGAGNRPAIEPSLLKTDAAPSCRIDVFGGSYYGYRWNDDDVLLTTPRVGPGAHKARFSFVRVKSSPPAWQERLLVNSYVLGVCATGADEVLQRLCELPADAEPRIERAGLLDVADDCLVPAPEDARRRRPTSAVRRRRDLEHAGRDRRGLPLGRRAGGGVARAAVSPGWGLCRATKRASTSRHRADAASIDGSRAGREGGLPRSRAGQQRDRKVANTIRLVTRRPRTRPCRCSARTRP